MIRIIKSVPVEGSSANGTELFWVKGFCLSDDEKPEKKYALGSELTEVDTGKVYVYNESTEDWIEKA